MIPCREKVLIKFCNWAPKSSFCTRLISNLTLLLTLLFHAGKFFEHVLRRLGNTCGVSDRRDFLCVFFFLLHCTDTNHAGDIELITGKGRPRYRLGKTTVTPLVSCKNSPQVLALTGTRTHAVEG